MAATLKSVNIVKDRSTVFPNTTAVALVSVVSVIVSCSGENSVSFKFAASGTSGTIMPGETKVLFANVDPLTDTINFTFNGASNIEVISVIGVGGGSTTVLLQDIIDILTGVDVSLLSGKFDTITFQEFLIPAITIFTELCLSVTLVFEGTGGKLGTGLVTVPDGFVASYSGTFRNQLTAIPFRVPTIANFLGNKRVLVMYSKI